MAKSLDELADHLDVEDFAAIAAAMRAQYVIFTAWLRCQTITEEWWARRATVQWPPEQAYRYTILQAAVSGRMGGGVTWSFGPRPGGKWGQGVPAFCERLGVLVDRAGALLFGTRPSRAYVTKGAQDWPAEGPPLNGLPYCATESPDGKKTFVHVILPPKERSFQLPVPADGRRFSSARLLDHGRKVSLLTELSQVLTPGQMKVVGEVQSELLRDPNVMAQTKAGTEAMTKIMEANKSKMRVPDFMSVKVTLANQMLRLLEGKLNKDVVTALEKGFESGTSFVDLMKKVPASQRMEVLRALGQAQGLLSPAKINVLAQTQIALASQSRKENALAP